MRKFIFICCLVAVFAGWSDTKKNLTDDERAARRAELMRRTGGPVKLPPKGFVALIDCQSRADFDKNSEKFRKTFEGFGFATKEFKSDKPFEFRDLTERVKQLKAGSVVFVIDDPNLPMSLVSIETRSGVVNVGALDSDNPSPALLTRRAGKLIGRVAMMVSGGAESDAPTSSMKTVTSLKELDLSEGLGDEVYVMMGVIRGMAKAGVMAERRMSYKQACKLGEAPAPTNDIQRAVWEQVRSEVDQKPSNPILILPGQKPDAK